MEADAGAIIVADKAAMAAPARTGTISERKLLIVVSFYAGRLPLLRDGPCALDDCEPQILGAAVKRAKTCCGRVGGF